MKQGIIMTYAEIDSIMTALGSLPYKNVRPVADFFDVKVQEYREASLVAVRTKAEPEEEPKAKSPVKEEYPIPSHERGQDKTEETKEKTLL